MTEKHNGEPERPLGKSVHVCVLASSWAASAIDFSRCPTTATIAICYTSIASIIGKHVTF